MESILTQIISLLYGGLTGMASSLGTGLNTLVQDLFVTGAGTQADPYQLSLFGGVVVVFAAIGLAVGFGRWVVNFVTSLGARNS